MDTDGVRVGMYITRGHWRRRGGRCSVRGYRWKGGREVVYEDTEGWELPQIIQSLLELPRINIHGHMHGIWFAEVSGTHRLLATSQSCSHSREISYYKHSCTSGTSLSKTETTVRQSHHNLTPAEREQLYNNGFIQTPPRLRINVRRELHLT